MGKEITISLKSFLEEELRKLMADYDKYRAEIAQRAFSGEDVEEALKEESLWEGRIKSLKDLLKGKTTVRSKTQKDCVALGSRITVQINGKQKNVIIDGLGYKTKEVEIISQNSPIGKELIGKKLGDVVVTKTVVVSVEEISYPW